MLTIEEMNLTDFTTEFNYAKSLKRFQNEQFDGMSEELLDFLSYLTDAERIVICGTYDSDYFVILITELGEYEIRVLPSLESFGGGDDIGLSFVKVINKIQSRI